mmetsp:Transcript_33000/g.105303  ORF Transcript_33000/g.105303 Transcript_33000/m.105303 type:complete len:203 (+) Transcript_33000:465-1073(+)
MAKGSSPQSFFFSAPQSSFFSLRALLEVDRRAVVELIAGNSLSRVLGRLVRTLARVDAVGPFVAGALDDKLRPVPPQNKFPAAGVAGLEAAERHAAQRRKVRRHVALGVAGFPALPDLPPRLPEVKVTPLLVVGPHELVEAVVEVRHEGHVQRTTRHRIHRQVHRKVAVVPRQVEPRLLAARQDPTPHVTRRERTRLKKARR